ncbi:uncharacterized protein [Parasteatoda tepidariorum]|uniref:uncharacterized protein n=1 Tax=Parasteatoda tepidariorum TaxID=114398 RepID=UPI001C71AB39|nr:pre-rRNA-processing protein esf2 isoform X2 [Parasteatoda tepidariorum]XP_042898980.1 pre-rRNA-processing protein esf2 isoform X2 [Parasteatoda tepidariorum]
MDTTRKIKKPGIIYLNFIPRYITVTKVREIFSDFGEVRRIFLKPEKTRPGKQGKIFTEGWVEFTKKKVAKRVAECLNGTQVGGKRRTPYYDSLWSIKYLPKFQWSHLSGKKAYEKSKKVHKMKAEISKIKREINFYSRGLSYKKIQ